MPVHRLILAAAILAAFSAAPVRATPTHGSSCALAITHAQVVPMDRERVLADRTVMVEAGRIVSISRRAPDPGCRRVIDAKGRYLVPGLNDMHVHIETLALAQAFGVKAAPIDYPSEMALYMANGVTGIRVMSGAPDILAFRDRERGRRSPYPRLVTASPMLSGIPPVLPEPVTKILRSADEARAAVRQYKRDGYDFLKVRDNLPAPIFRAVIDEAGRVGLYVDGHVSQGQGLSIFDVLSIGQKGVAHLDNLQMAMSDPARDPDRLVKAMRDCGCFVETTLQVETNAIAQMETYPAMIARPELKYMHPLMLNAFWRKPHNPYLQGGGDLAFFKSLLAGEKVLLRKLYAGGVHIVAGTDALNPMIVPGVSLHDELHELVAAGFTPYQALRMATADPAAWVPGFADVGVLAPGRDANAVLVDGYPLHDIDALRVPAAVMINGHWMTRADLQRRLDRAAELYEKLQP